jgi:hypothetical protein
MYRGGSMKYKIAKILRDVQAENGRKCFKNVVVLTQVYDEYSKCVSKLLDCQVVIVPTITGITIGNVNFVTARTFEDMINKFIEEEV